MGTAWGPQISATNVALIDTIDDATETVVAVLTASGTSEICDQVVLSALVEVGPGPDTSRVVVRVRKGPDASGDSVGNFDSGQTLADDTLGTYVGGGLDEPGVTISQQQYCLTVECVDASDASTIANVLFVATVY